MARYREAKCKICRRVGQKLSLKGTRCLSQRCALGLRNYPPGLKGQERKKKISDYALQLQEKQKVRYIYGVLEKQFRNYYFKAVTQKGMTGENLLVLLERRLDNMIYRLGWANTRAQARQLVRHNHILVNGKKVNIPSFLVKANDTIAVKPKSQDRIKEILKVIVSPKGVPSWLEMDEDKLSAKVICIPNRQDIDLPINEALIVALYSK
ncbi:MAG: 30S ribosomal protein S4 [bacterium]|nr:30S ribosomal protein S4 [bacterium]